MTMSVLRASYSIDNTILRRFNETIPARERSRVVQSLMEKALVDRERSLELIAEEFESHPDFAMARETANAFGVCVADGLDGI
jgi:hypothetical protein